MQRKAPLALIPTGKPWKAAWHQFYWETSEGGIGTNSYWETLEGCIGTNSYRKTSEGGTDTNSYWETSEGGIGTNSYWETSESFEFVDRFLCWGFVVDLVQCIEQLQ